MGLTWIMWKPIIFYTIKIKWMKLKLVKTLFISGLFLLISTAIRAQTIDTIEKVVLPNGDVHYRYQGKIITRNWGGEHAQLDATALEHWRHVKRNGIGTTVFGFAGGFCLGDFIVEQGLGTKYSIVLLPVGAALILLAIPCNVYRRQEYIRTIEAINQYLVRRAK